MPNRRPPESCPRTISSPGIRNLPIRGEVTRGGKSRCSGHGHQRARVIIAGPIRSEFVSSWARDVSSSETWVGSSAHHVESGVGIAELADAIPAQE